MSDGDHACDAFGFNFAAAAAVAVGRQAPHVPALQETELFLHQPHALLPERRGATRGATPRSSPDGGILRDESAVNDLKIARRSVTAPAQRSVDARLVPTADPPADMWIQVHVSPRTRAYRASLPSLIVRASSATS